MLVEDKVQVDRAVTKEEEEPGEFRWESSNMYSGSNNCPNVCMFFTKVDNP